MRKLIKIEKLELNLENQTILKKYQAYLLTEKHLADNSICSYVLDIYKYLNYLEKHKVKDYSAITKTDLFSYLENLDQENYSIYSVVRKLSALKSFHSYLKKQYAIEDITTQIETPKFYKKIPNVLSIEEVDRLLNIKLETAYDYRNKAMLELMYATGLRVSELVNLTPQNIDLDEKFVRLFGKGNKERIIPIGEVAIKYLVIYLEEYRDSLKKDIYVINFF